MRTTHLVTAALLVAGCTGGGESVPTTTVELVPSSSPSVVPAVSDSVPDTADALASYFVGLSDGTASAAAEPGSDAAWYADFQEQAREVLALPAADTVDIRGDVVEVCTTGECVVFRDMVHDPDSGRVVGFTVDDVPLSGRIIDGGTVQTVDEVSLSVAGAYRTTSGDTLVLIEVDNRSDVRIEVFPFAAVFRSDGDGGGLEATGAWGGPAADPAESTMVMISFPGTGVAGHVSLTGLRSDGIDLSFDLATGP